jgi:hypothetical protein
MVKFANAKEGEDYHIENCARTKDIEFKIINKYVK